MEKMGKKKERGGKVKQGVKNFMGVLMPPPAAPDPLPRV